MADPATASARADAERARTIVGSDVDVTEQAVRDSLAADPVSDDEDDWCFIACPHVPSHRKVLWGTEEGGV